MLAVQYVIAYIQSIEPSHVLAAAAIVTAFGLYRALW